MHREEQVLQAAKSAIEAQPGIAAAVFAHRTLTLSPDDQELPAVCVNNGADAATEEGGYSNLAFIDSVVDLVISIYAQADTQQELATELDRLRVAVHKAMLASPRTLGLSFVMGIGYGGAGAPEYSDDGSPLAARRDLSFPVSYRMGLTDPE
jgi:hypothetical protein